MKRQYNHQFTNKTSYYGKLDTDRQSVLLVTLNHAQLHKMYILNSINDKLIAVKTTFLIYKK